MMRLLEKTLKGLKEMLDDKQQLLQYRGYGNIRRTIFTFNPPVEKAKIDAFENDIGYKLPEDYKYFLTIHNGADLYEMLWEGKRAGGGFELFPLEQLIKEFEYSFEDFEKPFLPIAYWEDEDRVLINLEDVANNSKEYIYVYGESELKPLKLNFESFLDTYSVAQGTFFFEWPYLK